MIGAITSAAAGMRAASDRFDKAAATIASAGPANPVDQSSAVADVFEAKISYEMNVAVLRAANEMSERLLDVMV